MARRVTDRHLARAQRAIPPQLQRLGYKDGPAAPRATDDLDTGTKNLPPADAFKRFYIQMMPLNSYNGVYLDLDYSNAEYRLDEAVTEDRVLPPSYWIVNDVKGNVQPGWFLRTPVHNNEHSSRSPLVLFHAVRDHYATVLGSDPSFGAHIMRNPVHPVAKTRFGEKNGGYTLRELATVLPDPGRPDPATRPVGKSTRGAGFDIATLRAQARTILGGNRNVWLANGAGRGFRAETMVGGVMYVCDNIGDTIRELNSLFTEPMDEQRVARVIRSLDREALQHEAGREDRQRFAAENGRKSGVAKRKRTFSRDVDITEAFTARHGDVARLSREYKMSSNGVKLVLRRSGVYPSKSERDAEIIARFNQGQKIARIARELNIPVSRPTVYRCLQRHGLAD